MFFEDDGACWWLLSTLRTHIWPWGKWQSETCWLVVKWCWNIWQMKLYLSLMLLFYYQHLFLFIATIINSFLFCHESDPTFTKVSKVKEESELRPPHSVPLPFSDVSNNWSFYHYCLVKGVWRKTKNADLNIYCWIFFSLAAYLSHYSYRIYLSFIIALRLHRVPIDFSFHLIYSCSVPNDQ